MQASYRGHHDQRMKSKREEYTQQLGMGHNKSIKKDGTPEHVMNKLKRLVANPNCESPVRDNPVITSSLKKYFWS